MRGWIAFLWSLTINCDGKYILQMLHVRLVIWFFTVGQHVSYGIFDIEVSPGSRLTDIRWNSDINLHWGSSPSAGFKPSMFVTANGAGMKPSGRTFLIADLGGVQHSSLSHFTICKQYWLALMWPASHSWLGISISFSLTPPRHSALTAWAWPSITVSFHTSASASPALWKFSCSQLLIMHAFSANIMTTTMFKNCYITHPQVTPLPHITDYNKTPTHPPFERYIICARPLLAAVHIILGPTNDWNPRNPP